MLDVEEARALITTSLDDDDLEAVILREEDWLARRVGPLTGERVETFVTADGDEALMLMRRTLGVVVTDGSGDVSAFELRGWGDVLRTSGSWSGDVTVTYEPDDESEVKKALITLVRLTLNESAYQAQSAGGYSSTISLQDQRTQRYVAWRTLLRPRQPSSMRLRSTIPFGGKTVQSVALAPVES